MLDILWATWIFNNTHPQSSNVNNAQHARNAPNLTTYHFGFVNKSTANDLTSADVDSKSRNILNQQDRLAWQSLCTVNKMNIQNQSLDLDTNTKFNNKWPQWYNTEVEFVIIMLSKFTNNIAFLVLIISVIKFYSPQIFFCWFEKQNCTSSSSSVLYSNGAIISTVNWNLWRLASNYR